MIDKLISFLQWIQSSAKLKKTVDLIFSFLFMLVSMSLTYTVLKETVLRSSYCYGGYSLYYDSCGGSFFLREEISGSGLRLVLILSLLLALIGVYIYGIYRKIRSHEFSLIQLILNGILPLLIGIGILSMSTSGYPLLKWYILLFGGLYAFSPVALFFSGIESLNACWFGKIFGMYKKYIVSFLIGFSIFLLFYSLSEVFGAMSYMDRFSEFFTLFPFFFLFICLYGVGTWVILTYSWAELGEVSEAVWRNILRGGVALAFLFLFIWMSPDWKVVIIEGRIDAAQIIIAQDGETKESLKDASNIWFLEWAMKDQYLNKTLGEEERELYAKIYDRDIESVINTPVDTDQYRTWSSNATSILAHGANAKVDLNFAKHETEVLSDISATRTTVTYEFQNTTNTNQEVIFNIELPNIESAMTDLRLGLNLEYLGAVAPRGAASNVYQDSLKRNMDPALLEQTSPLTYRLRAFPVPSNTDATTQGRQKIQFTYVTPLSREGMITLIPKTTILNLKLTKKSEIITRVMNGDTALEQDSVSGDDLATLQDGKMKKFDIALQKSYGEYCSTNTYTNFDPSRIDTPIKKLTRNIVFFDISKSVGEKSESRKQYQSLIDTWKSNGISLDIYSYNFDIYPSGYDMNSIEFWGNTDMAKVVEYILKNNLSNANIVIVTDDNSYEKASNEIKTIDYKKLKSNTISLIQVGNKIRTLKTEVTKAILATDGAMISLDEKSPLTESVKQIFMPKPTIGICEDYSGNSLSSLQSLQGYSDGRKVFGEIYSYSGQVQKKEILLAGKDYYQSYEYGNHFYVSYADGKKYTESEWEMINHEFVTGSISIIDSQILEKIATSAHIVNQAVSMIALVTDRQREDLDRYSQQADKYDSRYTNLTNKTSMSNNLRSRENRFYNDERSSGCGVLGCDKAHTLQATSSSMDFGSMMAGSLGDEGIGSVKSGGMIQYIFIIIGFPLVAWFILRRKPKTKIAEKRNEFQNPKE